MPRQPKGLFSMLIVGDNEISRSALTRWFRFKTPELELHIADCCESGIDLCKRQKIDMVITDIKSACLQCHDIVGTIRQINYDAEFILITSSSDVSVLNAASEKKNVTLVQMPVDLEELLEVTRSKLAKIASKHGRRAAVTS